MNTFMKTTGLILLSIMMSPSVWALGTNAGTAITNTATATYNIAGTTLTQDSPQVVTTVAELLDVNVVWQDSANIAVSAGDTSRVTTYLITNTGNGTDTYTLAAQSTLAGDQFDPVLVGVFLDSNGNGVYDGPLSATPDAQYIAGVNDPVLTANDASTESLTVFVLNDIPSPLADGLLGDTQITVSSNTAALATPAFTAGGVNAGAGEGGTDAVIGASGGTVSDTGTYVVSSVVVSVVKSASVLDPLSGTDAAVTGAVITYSIVVTVTGTGTATAMVITDPVPANTVFNLNTLALNSAPLTDAIAGDDAGDVGITSAGVVTVSLGDLSSASAVQTITFDVTIQ